MSLWKRVESAFKPPKRKRIRIIDPEKLLEGLDFPSSKNYEKYKKVYNWKQVSKLGHTVRGKKVRYWRLIHNCRHGAEGDEYIPIYKRRRKRRRKR